MIRKSKQSVPRGEKALRLPGTLTSVEQEIPMFQIRFIIALLLTVAFLPGSLAAQYSSSDSGQYVILNAQYGTARKHVDVTNRLKEIARQDRTFRMGNSTFGVDPDPGQVKTLRIYARGPNGQERMFEYREGSTVDGSMFSSWGRGDWGNDPWHGGWEGGGGYQPQPEMAAALQNLREAQRNLESASRDKGGHRVKALERIQQAIAEVEAGIQYDNTHRSKGEDRRH
jgi:hypothetical protein